eukprot:jgi/Chrpa1/24682/Chrysochromulina_OHIO_Genome00008149-RA
MLQMPAAFAPLSPKSHFSLTWLVQVKCMLTITSWRACDLAERSRVSSEVAPPAPQVMSIKSGSCAAITSIVSCSFSTPSGVLGGKYSNEMNGCFVLDVHSATMSQILPFLTFGRMPRLSSFIAAGILAGKRQCYRFCNGHREGQECVSGTATALASAGMRRPPSWPVGAERGTRATHTRLGSPV